MARPVLGVAVQRQVGQHHAEAVGERLDGGLPLLVREQPGVQQRERRAGAQLAVGDAGAVAMMVEAKPHGSAVAEGHQRIVGRGAPVRVGLTAQLPTCEQRRPGQTPPRAHAAVLSSETRRSAGTPDLPPRSRAYPHRVPSSIDVVIVAYNRYELTESCLRHLSSQTVDHHVIVVDNGSTDDTRARIGVEWPEVQLERFDDNQGFPQACNRGVGSGSGEFVVLLNNDVDCGPDFLERLVRPLRDPTVGSVASLMLQPGGETIDSMGLAADAVLAGFPRLQGLPCARARDDSAPVLAGPAGAAAAYRRAAWEQIGGLDETIVAYMEDFDLALRLRMAGWRTVAEPRAAGVHLGSATNGYPLAVAATPRRVRTRIRAPPLWAAARRARRPARSPRRPLSCSVTSPSRETSQRSAADWRMARRTRTPATRTPAHGVPGPRHQLPRLACDAPRCIRSAGGLSDRATAVISNGNGRAPGCI